MELEHRPSIIVIIIIARVTARQALPVKVDVRVIVSPLHLIIGTLKPLMATWLQLQ
jgi:hypothetical protein